MKKYRIPLLIVFVAMMATQALRAQSNCYVRLEDASGYTPNAMQIEALEQAAAELCLAFDSSGFGGQFKVYDFGFYLHHETTAGGYPEPFARKVEEVAALSPYYLVFGKQSDRSGVYTRFWVGARLPDSLSFRFPCLDTIGAEILRTSLGLTANIEYEALGKMPSNYHLAEIRVMNKLKAEVDKLRECCYNQQRGLSSCDAPCLSSEEILEYYEQKGYVSIPVKITGNPLSKPSNDLAKSNLVEDYAEKLIQFIGIEDFTDYVNINEAIENDITVAIEDGVTAKGFITKNENFCEAITAEKILNDFSENELEAYIHFHLWQNPDSIKPDLMLVKFKEKIFEIELGEVVITPQADICGPLPLPHQGECCPFYAITENNQGVYHGHTGMAGNWTISDSVEYYRRATFDEEEERENIWNDSTGAEVVVTPSNTKFIPSGKAFLMAFKYPTTFLEKTFHKVVTLGPSFKSEREQIFQQFKYANLYPPNQNNVGTLLNWDCTSRLSHSLYNSSVPIQTSIQNIEMILKDWLENHDDFDSLFLDRNKFSYPILPNPSLWNLPIWAFQAFGGTQGIKIEVRSLKAFPTPCYGYPIGRRFQCEIYFTIIDNFGVGMSDGEKWFFPGLVEQWVLQHYRNFDCDRPPCYIPITNHTARIYHKFDICLSN